MGIIVISAGCEVRSRVQGKSGDLSCHGAGGRGWACAGCRHRRTRELQERTQRIVAGLHL